MAEYQSSDHLTILNLQIDNKVKEREIYMLKERISQLEGHHVTREKVQPGLQVTNVTPSGQIQLDVCDAATSNVTHQRSEETAQRSSPHPHEGRVVRIEAKKHAGSFHFEKKDDWVRNLTDEVTELSDEMRRRNCLAKAVRQNCGHIANNVLMQEGLFLDELFSVRCLDDEDRKMISLTRKDETNQMRAVIVIVLKKDFRSILALVSCIRENNRELAEQIIRSYKDLVTGEFGKEENCWWCLLGSRVKFAVFVDKLLSNDLIDEELYMDSSREDLSPEKRKQVWTQLSKQLVSNGNIRDAMEYLRVAIDDTGVYHDIVSLISQEMTKVSCSLQCTCGPQMLALKVSEFEADKDGDSGHNSACGDQGQGHIRGEGDVKDVEKSSGFGCS